MAGVEGERKAKESPVAPRLFQCLGELDSRAVLRPPVGLLPCQLLLCEVADVLDGGEQAGGVGHDQHVDQHGEEVVCSGRLAAACVLQQADEHLAALHDAVQLASRRLLPWQQGKRVGRGEVVIIFQYINSGSNDISHRNSCVLRFMKASMYTLGKFL